MAFTFSHPAIVFPIYKKHPSKFSLVGLVMGSLVPDIHYFIDMSFIKYIPIINKLSIENYWSISTFIFFYLPCSLILAFLFCNVIKPILILNSPKKVQARLMNFYNFRFSLTNAKIFLKFLYSNYIGVISHAIWDECTHPGTFIAQKISILKTRFLILDLSTWLYLITSIIGICFLLFLFFKIKQSNISSNLLFYSKYKKIVYWLIIIMCGIIKCIIDLENISNIFKGYTLLHNVSLLIGVFRVFIISFTKGSVIALILISISLKIVYELRKENVKIDIYK